MRKIKHTSGAIEIVLTEEEIQLKDKLKAKKKAADLTDTDIKDLIWHLAKEAKLL